MLDTVKASKFGTIPQELLGGLEQGTDVQDSGPFYVFSPAFTIHREDQRDSTPHIWAAKVAAVHDSFQWLEDQMAAPHKIATKEVVEGKQRIRWAANPISASSTLEAVMSYNTRGGDGVATGLIQVKSLAHLPTKDARLDIFNKLIQPVEIMPRRLYDAQLSKEIKESGGLAVRRKFVESGLREIASREFANASGKDLQSTYLAAGEEILASFEIARVYCEAELSASEAEMRLTLAGAGGKPDYDQRDFLMLWLLARPEINAGGNKPVVVQLPDGMTVGRQDIAAIAAAAAAEAVRGVLASQGQAQPFVQVGEAPTRIPNSAQTETSGFITLADEPTIADAIEGD